jgi:signal transduction histidine kinase
VRRLDDISGVRARRVLRSDALVPVALGVVGAVEMVAGAYDRLGVGLGTYWLAVGALGARRRAPLAVPLAVGTIYALTPVLGFDASVLASWLLILAVACLGCGLYAPRARRYAGLACVVGCLAISMAGLAWFTDLDPNVLFGLILSVGPWALGVALRSALDHNRRLGAETERARVERGLAAERAAASERRRISAELHDALAHALGAMVIQASVAGDLVRRDPEAAAAALGSVAQAGRDALGETGRLLRLLRDERDELGLQLRSAPIEPGGPAMPEGAAAASPRVQATDVLLPAVFGVIGTAEIAWEGYGSLWALLGVYWLAVGVLCARRALALAMPIAVAGIFGGAQLLGIDTSDMASTILVLGLACFAAGLHVPRSSAIAGLTSVIAAVALMAGANAAETGHLSDVMLEVAFVAPWAVGVALGNTLERTRALAAEAERASLEGELETERAAALERRRIARELHDLLANSLSVMIVQASLAAELVDTDPAAATAAIGEVERSGRTALDEIGVLLRLGQDDSGGFGVQPQHGVADLPALADEYERAGLGIDLEVDGVAPRLPVGVELSTYRIVQEALTNALKHAPGSPVRVRLARAGSEVAIEVRNGPAAAAGFAVAPGGHGLTGLRERVALFGGALDAGPTPDGGFVLAATLPVEEPSR